MTTEEEVRAGVFPIGVGWDSELGEAIEKYAAAVSAKAGAEERERAYREGWNAGVRVAGGSPLLELLDPLDSRARSSEEAEVCLHPRVSRMAAVGGPIICGVCGEEAGNGSA